MQITTGLNIASPHSANDNVNKNEKLEKKAFIDDAKNEEISNFKYFNNFISDNMLEKIRIWPNFSIDDSDKSLRTKLNSNKRKTLNYNKESLKVVIVPDCNLENCQIGNGRCVSENKCQCNYAFINVSGVSKLACDFKLSYQLTATILEILFPIGFGHFYCKRYLIGFIKFSVLFVIPLIIYAIFKAYFVDNKEDFYIIKNNGNRRFKDFFSLDNIIKRQISFYFIIIFAMWYLFDLVIFVSNKHKDGSGFDLIPIYNH